MQDLTAPTADGTAGMGVELESPQFFLGKKNCTKNADTGNGIGRLNAEYIFDGRQIKVGSEDAVRAGAEAAADLIEWHPWFPRIDPSKPNTVNVEGSEFNPWDIDAPGLDDDPADVEWSPQVTTPMPLEGLYSLMVDQRKLGGDLTNRNILNGIPSGDSNLEYLSIVTAEYFESRPNGMDPKKVTNDVLGFCSLVLSYAKAASKTLESDESPKLRLTFMPRTEFNTIYNQVKLKIPGNLFALFNTLACYKTIVKKAELSVIVDTDYCTGTATNPVSNNKFGELTYTNIAAKPATSVNIKTWIQDIGSGTGGKDALSAFDESIDGSIGGLQTRMEKMYNSERFVPLFEFRDLKEIKTPEIEAFMRQADDSIQEYHHTFAKVP